MPSISLNRYNLNAGDKNVMRPKYPPQNLLYVPQMTIHALGQLDKHLRFVSPPLGTQTGGWH